MIPKLKELDESNKLMSEKLIKLYNTDLNKLFGPNNKKLDKIRSLFPKVKIIARGEEMKILGDKKNTTHCEEKILSFIKHIEKYDSLNTNEIERIFESEEEYVINTNQNIILHGQYGKIIKAKTANQRTMLKQIKTNDILFAIGPAGTGKTYTAVALAVKALKEKHVKRIILTRPAIEAGENLGFLPGDLKEKLDPYMQPIYDALSDMFPYEKLNDYLEKGIIQIAPLAFMRGRTLDNAFVILDEAQNTTENQIKMFLTRMGNSAKFIITADETQIDLPKNQVSGIISAQKKLIDIKGIAFIYLDEKDVIRHKLVKQIIKVYKNN